MTLKKLLTSIFLVCVALVQSVGYADEPVTKQLADTMSELAGGPHPGLRDNHAEGVLAKGHFMPSASAQSITRAPHMQGVSSEVVVRFSNATGVPNIDDASPDSFPKGMAIRFVLPDEQSTDMVLISVDRFPVQTPEKFLELLKAIGHSKGSTETPTPIETFLSENPATKTFVELDKPAPVGFTTQTYHGINAFKFVNASGEVKYGRYKVEPVLGNEFLSDSQRAEAGPDYLMEELPKRLANAPAAFRISVQVAEPGDELNDPTVVWPNDRPMVELGTLTLDAMLENAETYARANMFNPLALVDGIEPSNDPVLLARPAAYAASFAKRAQ